MLIGGVGGKYQLTDRNAYGIVRIMKSHNDYLSELFRIINGALRLDIDKVRNFAAFLADKLERDGDKNSAHRLRKLLEESDHQLRPAGSSFGKVVPVDSESRFPLLELVDLKAQPEPPLVLPQEQWDTLNEFLSIAKSHAQIEAQGVDASLSLLIYGPPGTGKTRIARYIARDLGLDLYIARLDGLISSFLGSTSKNIRALFEFASKTPCILFLDEFDAIAKLRGDTQELGELKRVVNSFIQNLDSIGAQSIVIAATNHQELLDAAIWRRFNYRLATELPTPDMRLKMWSEFIRPIEWSAKEMEILNDLSDGFSGSDIQGVCLRLHRKRVATRQLPTMKDAFQILRNIGQGSGEEHRFVSQLRDRGEQEIAAALHKRRPKLYSLSAVAALLGVSKMTAQRWTKEVESDA